MNQSSVLFILKSALFSALVIAILLGALMFSGVVTLKNGWIPDFFGTDPASLLERKVKVPSEFSEEAGKIALKNIETARVFLRDNPENAEAWLDLAISYKTVDDLEGAVKIWKFLENT